MIRPSRNTLHLQVYREFHFIGGWENAIPRGLSYSQSKTQYEVQKVMNLYNLSHMAYSHDTKYSQIIQLTIITLTIYIQNKVTNTPKQWYNQAQFHGEMLLSAQPHCLSTIVSTGGIKIYAKNQIWVFCVNNSMVDHVPLKHCPQGWLMRVLTHVDTRKITEED